MRQLSPLQDALLLALGVLIIAVILLITVLFPPARARGDVPTAYAPVPSIDFRMVTEPAVSAPPRRLAPDQVSGGHSTDASRYHRWPGPSIAPGSVAASLPVASAPILGEASWYRWRVGQAAAGPALRIGAWRGRFVRVCAETACAVVQLTDWCACYGTRVIDLDARTFARLAPLSRGVLEVRVNFIP